VKGGVRGEKIPCWWLKEKKKGKIALVADEGGKKTGRGRKFQQEKGK